MAIVRPGALRICVLPVLLLAGGGCQRDARKADAGAQRDAIAAGRWRVTRVTVAARFPDARPGGGEAMAAMFDPVPETGEFCLSQAEAAEGARALAARLVPGGCEPQALSDAQGRIEARWSCRAGQGIAITRTLTASHTRTRLSGALTEQRDGSGEAAMALRAGVLAERIGACAKQL